MTIKFEGTEMDIDKDGRIGWCSDWRRMGELIRRGVVRTETSRKPGEYGHTDHYICRDTKGNIEFIVEKHYRPEPTLRSSRA